MRALRRHALAPLVLHGAVCCALLLGSGCQSLSGISNPFSWPGSADKTAAKPAAKTTPVAKKGRAAEADITAKLAQGGNLERTNKLEDARAIYEGLIAAYPERYEAYHRLGIVADRQKRFSEAETLYSNAIRLHPNDAELFNDLGYCFFLEGKLEKAEAATQKAVTLVPANPRFHNNLGMILGHQGRHEEALAEFRRAGNESTAQYNLAFVLTAQNNPEGAKRCFNLALAADPSFEPARKALASFEQFDRDPSVRQSVAQDGVRWIPYLEGGADEGATVQTSGQTTSATSTASRLVPSTRPDTQSQLKRARSLMADNVQTPP